MSYDYNALLTSLASHRVAAATAASEDTTKYAEALQESLQVFDTLSGHCPMTPLLWMQYAHDMSELLTCVTSDENNETARQSQLETLEVGLNEFPGSAILQLHYCELLVQSLLLLEVAGDKSSEQKIPKVQQALLRALDQVGKGSHRNQADIVVWLYRLYAQFALCHLNNQNVALASILQRARTPLKDVNDSLQHEVQMFFKAHKIPTDTQADFCVALDEARRWEAKAFARLQSCEETVDVALYQEHISYQMDDALQELLATDAMPTDATSFTFVTTSKAFTERVLKGKPLQQQPRYWMGLGGAATAQAFLQYATASRKLKLPQLPEDHVDDNNNNNNNNTFLQKQQHQLVLSVFERGLAECPTVEALWLAYLKHLTWLWNNNNDQDNLNTPTPATMKTIANRAVRNCPFSLALVQQQLHIALLLTNTTATDDANNAAASEDTLMDPDKLLAIVHKALDSKFLPAPAQALDLYLTAIRVVQRRVLSILATSVVGYSITTKQQQHKNKNKKQVAVVLPYDEAELLPSQVPKTNNAKKNAPVTTATPATPATVMPLDEDAWQDVQDLCADVQDMFEDAMSRLNKDHASWTEGRALLLQEWSLMEQIVIVPLLSMSNTNISDNNSNESSRNGSHDNNNNVLAQLEKVIRLHHPPHPDSYRALIQHVLHHGTTIAPATAGTEQKCPGDIVSKLRQVRGLYQKAIQSVGKAKMKDSATIVQQTMTTTTGFRDYETALSCLCHDYQEFERIFGSEQSWANATRFMQKKLQKTAFPTVHTQQQQQQAGAAAVAPVNTEAVAQPSKETTPMEVDKQTSKSPQQTKRKASDAGEAEKDVDVHDPPAKKRKTDKVDKEEEADQTTEQPKPPQPPPQQPKKHHKVKIGQIFHRAHPFTVRVSNLAVQTEEMDLIETFRQEHKCGAVVHARIQREKPLHAKGKEAKVGISKGWGLLQFEERESVEKALELNQKVELHGKTLHVERSHVPAVGIVPPGMHRHHHGAPQDKNKTHNDDKGPEAAANSAPAETKKKSSTAGILAFRPRGVTQKKPAVPKNARPKVKLNLGSGDDNADAAAKK